MTPAITDQMRQALDAEPGQQVKIVDEKTSQVQIGAVRCQACALHSLPRPDGQNPRRKVGGMNYDGFLRRSSHSLWNVPGLSVRW